MTARTDNLRTTFRRWEEKKHPIACATCRHIWGESGAPSTFEEYVQRYPKLAHGAKRHLTMPWEPGLTLEEVAAQAACTVEHVQTAIDNDMLQATEFDGQLLVTRTNATLWAAAKAPAGDGARSWVTLAGAGERYGFTAQELQDFIATGALKPKTAAGVDGAADVVLVSRRQCGQLRDQLGFTIEHAALRLQVSIPDLQQHLVEVGWRRSGELIPLPTIRILARRLAGRRGDVSGAPEQDDGWIVAKAAMEVAGVSLATLGRWTDAGDVQRRSGAGGWRYCLDDVKRQARSYWVARTRGGAARPAWLVQEQQSETPEE